MPCSPRSRNPPHFEPGLVRANIMGPKATFLLFSAAVLLLFFRGAEARCPRPSDRLKKGVCAKIWDEDDCTGWEVESGVGYHEFGSFSGKSDDAEAVAVAPGCVLTVYDEDDEDVEKRGDSRVFDNSQGRDLLVAEITGSLDEDVESYECYCGCGRVRFPPGVDCMVFDDEDCEVDDWDAPLNYTGRRISRQNGNLGLLSEKSFSLTRGLGNFKYKNTIESVAVRRGCQLEVFDDSDFSDDAHTFRARDDSDLFVPSLEDHPDDAVASLDDDIESLRCECRPSRTGIIGALFGNNNNNNG